MHLFPLNVELRSIQHRTEPPRMYPGPPLCQQINPKKSANNGTLMPVYVLTSNNILLMHRLQCKSKDQAVFIGHESIANTSPFTSTVGESYQNEKNMTEKIPT
uniref:Uncharacterized protein LOC111129421 n=1 Tax=Crassostrea virginica TaxID=6565 RepID=A0A8B8DWY0_CRAVI|nr:uncharacterized protein LOC111129421 [Crassostrea virginica]